MTEAGPAEDVLALACRLAAAPQGKAKTSLSAPEHDLVRALGDYFRQQGIEAARAFRALEEGESYDR